MVNLIAAWYMHGLKGMIDYHGQHLRRLSVVRIQHNVGGSRSLSTVMVLKFDKNLPFRLLEPPVHHIDEDLVNSEP